MVLDGKYLEIKKAIKKVLDKERYQHTLGVAYTAASLAMKYGEDIDRAFIAGILHDCAKNIPVDERVTKCEKWGIKMTDVERKNTSLLHAKMGAYLAKEQYGITDPGILSAVAYHTTGRAAMTLLEMIIYVADYIEPNRDRAPNLKEIRRTAFEDIDRAVFLIARDTIEYVSHKDSADIDPASMAVYEYYKNTF